jgi:excisionase family DNA binding protein
VGEGARRDARRRLTVDQAADQLGVSVDAVRARIKRNTIAHERQGGRVYVLLDTDQGADQGTTRADHTAELIATLREQLQAERRANEENRRIIAALTQRIPELPASPGSASSQEPSESPPEATEQPGRVGPQPEVEGAQEPSDALGGPGSGTARGSWWRKMFGG